MLIILWIIAILTMSIGGLGWFANRLFQPLHHFETEEMRKSGGKIDDKDPDFVGQFRITQSEWEKEDNEKTIKNCLLVFRIGCVAVALLAIYTFFK